jgi:hypothetical protein
MGTGRSTQVSKARPGPPIWFSSEPFCVEISYSDLGGLGYHPT